MNTLGSELPKQIERCAKLVQIYKGLPGGVGAWGAMAIQQDIDFAHQAIAEQDIVKQVQAYKRLEECK